MKKFLIILLKVGVSLGIIAYLVWEAAGAKNPQGENVFQQLVNQSKDWGLLALAWVFCASAVFMTMVRWWYLVRGLDLPFGFTDALRIGFLGYLFNLAPMGIVGGDLLKGWLLAREHRRDQLAKAVASVIMDRTIGLYMLFVVASAAIFLTGFWWLPDLPQRILAICYATFILTAAATVGLIILLGPDLTDGKVIRAFGRIPRVGHSVESLIVAVRMYSHRWHVLVISALMSVMVHSLFATGIYLIARGLPGHVLSLKTHFVISPLSAVTGVIPLPLGPFEWVLEMFYVHVPEQGVVITKGQGFVVALGYRLVCLLIAAVGICYYLGSRQEVAEVVHEHHVAEHPTEG